MLNRSLDSYKDVLPARSKRDNFPHILWVAPPTHKFFSEANNEKRVKFTTALSTVVSLQQNMSMLKLVKHWSHDDSNLFLQEQYRYTADGLAKYWLSVDASIKFWDVAILKKFTKGKFIATKPAVNTKKSEEIDETAEKTSRKKNQRPEAAENPEHYTHTEKQDDRNKRYHEHRDSDRRRYATVRVENPQRNRNDYSHYESNYKYGQWYDDRHEDYRYQNNYRWRKQDYKKSSRRLPY